MAENRFAKYLTPPDVGPTYEAEDPIVKAAPKPDAPTPFQQNAEARAQEDQSFQREKFDWEKGQAEAKAKKESGEVGYSQSAIDAFDRAIGSAQRLIQHPGLPAMVGSGFDPASFGSFNPLPFADNDTPFAGTEASNFKAELDAMKAQVFLPMVQSMKGLGALSNAEGQKLTDAIGAMDPRMSEAQFKQSMLRIVGDLEMYRARSSDGTKRPRVKSGRTGLSYEFDVPAGADDATILAIAKEYLQSKEPGEDRNPVFNPPRNSPASGSKVINFEDLP